MERKRDSETKRRRKKMTAHALYPSFSNGQNPWYHNANPIWLGSTLSIHRNLEKFHFPSKLPVEKRKQIISLFDRDVLASQSLKKPQVYKAEDLAPIEKEFLVEHFLSQKSFQQALAGEAFLLDESKEFLGVFNIKDHLYLHLVDSRGELENAWSRLAKIESELSKSVSFAFSPKFGFLSSDSGECGTGLHVTAFLHIPMILHANRLQDILKKNKEDNIEYSGLHGDPHDIIGDIVAFHNNYTLGVTEENILRSIYGLATKLVIEESSLRSHFKQANENEQAEIKDKVSRAYGILLHSYQIEPIEALHALSWLKIGLEMGWLSDTTHEEINQLFFSCRRAHLLCYYGQKMIPEEIPHKRSEFIHIVLKKLKLLI